MEPATRTYDGWIGRDAYDRDGDKIGKIDDIYYDDATGRPEWVAVKTGLFGGNQTFVPIHGSQPHGDDDGDLRVAWDKDTIKSAPNISPDGRMTPMDEQELWEYYGYDYKSRDYGTADKGDARADKDFQRRRYDQATSEWRDVGAEESVTIQNQEARVVSQPETVRLRKYQRTEMVPVTKEEVRVERTTAEGQTTTERPAT